MSNAENIIHVITPLTKEAAVALKAGQQVLITGTILTGRDAAHKRLIAALDAGDEFPVDLNGMIIFYVGPTPVQVGRPIGSAGPTTSGRMDAYAPRLIKEKGLRGMIGKGKRSAEVQTACQSDYAVYFGAIGGLGALLGKCVESAEIVAYEDLGPEAIYKLVVKDFPAVVINDCHGGDGYESGRHEYEKKAK
ncbi:MAG: Fe-S-containing hydro-lyase [bacterium]